MNDNILLSSESKYNLTQFLLKGVYIYFLNDNY